jgi:nucleotide-binding universal stress UspA family protein
MTEQFPTSDVASAPRQVRDVAVAADGSEPSLAGLRLAADIARRTGAHVTVVHVRHLPAAALPMVGYNADVATQTLDEVQEETYRQAHAILDEAGASWRFVVRRGSAGAEIIEAARELGVDLIVIGSRRHSALHNAVVGSTAEHLVAHSPLPVLVAR